MSNSRNLLNCKFFLSLLLVMILAISSATAAFAATGTAAATTQVVIKLKLGSGQMTVDGVASAVQPPFQKSGVTFIPLSVLTKGIGAQLQLTDNKKMTLTHSASLKVALTTGSKDAYVNGVQKTLPAAPVAVKGVMMVPLRAAELLGAKVAFTASTKEIVIKGPRAAAAGGGKGGIDSDAGKSKIGDSYFQWSMNYPTGLAQTYQSTDGSALEFGDVKKEYYLGIFVTAAFDKLSPIEVRDKILSYYYDTETTVSKSTVTDSGLTFESVLTKDKNGLYYEYRGYQANDYLYVVAFGKKVSGPNELKQASGILNSFKTSFDASNTGIKDLTQVVEGYKTLKFEDYGLSLQLPKDWDKPEKTNYPYFEPKDGSAYLLVDVTSLEKGDTMDAWLGRRMERLKNTFDMPYYKQLERTQVTWNGVPAVMQKLSYTNDTKTWWDEYELFAIQGEYRYYAEFSFMQSRASDYETVFNRILKTSQIDYRKIASDFGEIVDDSDRLDRTAVSIKTSRKYGYSVSLPQYWTAAASDFESDKVAYSFYGGSFIIHVLEGMGDTQELYQAVDSSYNQSASDHKNEHIKENSIVSFAGTQAKRILMEDDGTGDSFPYKSTVYAFTSGSRGFVITVNIGIANMSDFNKKRIEELIASFKLNS